eukprot:CAMPEP_0168316984 /NCGR_PEP_ID=MMETSP0210-20121227/21505_1 /TAXON_ID=40633 /ORGANISM="Condylostoma magnum, Strain COL2" /LENGTH=101 /DNA_ID=CAMNT_0008309123 /DNA_START=1632 /DNA_END=1934 /DNA_ORIENTATION=-
MIYSFSVNGVQLKSAVERSMNMICPVVVTDPSQVDFIIYGTEAGDVVIRNCGTLDVVRRFVLRDSAPITSLVITNDLRFLVVGGADGELTVLTDPEAALTV